MKTHQFVATDCLKADISPLHQVKQVEAKEKIMDGGTRGAVDHSTNHSHQALSKQ